MSRLEDHRPRLKLFRDPLLKWDIKIEGQRSIGRISPSSTQFVAFCDMDRITCICVWDTHDRQLKAKLRTDPIHPLDVVFDPETRFCFHHDDCRVPFCYHVDKTSDPVPPSESEICHPQPFNYSP